MNTSHLNELVDAYINAPDKKSASFIYIHIEFYIIKYFLEQYKATNGIEAPKDFENNIDLKSTAETAILIRGGVLWHKD